MAVMLRANTLGIVFLIAALSVTVQGQTVGVVCRASVNCAGGLDDDLGRTTERGCCVDNPLGLAYVGGEGLCVPCIVLGFFRDSFSGIEQGPGHSVQVGYQKGAQVFRQNLVFRVLSTQGTAREGPQFDYTVNTLTARAFFSAPNPDNVVVTFRVDTIAQEPNETFTLTLDPFQTVLDTPRDGLYFLNTTEMTIVDNDNVEFLFTEDDFRANELGPGGAVSLMPVRVAKNVRIASQIELVVVPLTVQEAMATSLPLPPNIPSDDPFSPPFANLNDFNNASVTLIFEPDEDGTPMNERGAPIPIVDDAINEATEQVFVVELRLVSSLDPATVELDTRPSSLCRIIDNDPIRIGFELPGYTYMEPMFDTDIDQFYESPTGLTVNGPIYLAKENNVTSEQTFLLSIQATDSAPSGTNFQPATLDADYRIATPGQTSVTLTFLATNNMVAVQRINFQFMLFPDTLPEGTEAFRASVSPQDTRVGSDGSIETFPTFLNPESLASETFVVIEDNDPIIIGFANTIYTVNETIGMLEVIVQVFSPPDDQTLPATVELVIQTVSGSAIGGSDYREIIATSLDPFLIFNDNTRQLTFSVAITDDSFFEMDVEDFFLELRFNPFAAPPSNVQLRPNVSVVEILDDDEVVIGFLNTSYTVGESDGQANIQIGVIRGSLQRPVAVQFSTNAVSAADGSDYNGFTAPYTFDSIFSTIDVPVAITGDNIFELTELFSASLAFPGAPIPRVVLAPDSAEVTILDDDVLTFGFEPTEYGVSESAGSVDLRISFISGDAGEFVPHVNVSTVDGTATGSGSEADYVSVVEQSISFTSANRIQDLTVGIVNDSFTELNEAFSAVLTSVFLARAAGGAAIDLSDQERARLIRDPDTANVTILDDDMAIIGFVNTDLSISEDGGDLRFEIAVLQGTLRIDVPVNFATDNGTALAGLDYEATTSSLIFTDQSREFVSVNIINDTLFEDPENFFGRLSAAGVLPPNVRLAPILATATIIDDEGIVIGFDPDSYSVNETDGTVTLTVRVFEGTISEGRSIPVRVTTSDDSAQAPSDYMSLSEVVTFSSSSTIQSVQVTIVDDDLLEIDEVFTASLELVNAVDVDRIVLMPASAPVTIFDDDTAVIGFVPDAYSVIEGTDQFANLTVELISGQLGRQVVVSFNTQSGSAIDGSDFVGIIGRQLTFGPAVSSITVPVDIIDDLLLEELIESFSASLGSVVPRLVLLPDEATVDITDNEVATFGFDANQYSVIENARFVTVTIRQVSGGTLDRNVLITLQTGDGTAISSGERDFVAHSVDLTFGPGVTEQEVMITIIDDLRLETDEQFNSFVSLTVTDPAISLNPAQAPITIIDNDMVIIGFSQTLYQVAEDAGQAFVDVVVINGTLRRQVVVNVFTADDTALDGSDYNAVVPRPLTFDMDNLEFSIPIDILDDQVHELNEDFFGRLSTTDGDVVLQPQETRVRIADNDVVTFTFRQPVYMFMEDVGTGRVCVDKIGDTDQTITVIVNGAIQSGPLNRMLVFSPDTNSSCIDFPVMDDNIALEDPEEFIWTLQPVPIPRVELSINTTRVVIIDDDPLILNLVKAEDIPEAIGSAQACVTFSNPFARAFEIFPSVARPPNNSVPAIATPGVDYGDVVLPIMARPGDTEACFNIVIEDDILVEESQECLMASFTAEDLVNLEIGSSSSVCCIVDDDNVTIGFDPVMYSVNETAGEVILTVRVLDGQLARPVSVDFTTQDGTATSTAPADFNSVISTSPITLQFSPSDLVLQARVTIIDDTITENPELFSGLLTSLDSSVILAPDTASVEILDNDLVTIGFDPEEYVVSENDGSVTLMVRLISGVLEREVIVDFETTPGTATSADPADYERTVTQLTFSPIVAVNPVSVNIIDDDIHEDSENFFGVLTAPGQPAILNPDRALVTIVDDNDPITIGFERTEYNVSEDGQIEVCAVLTSGTLEKDVIVSVGSSDGTANVGADYVAVSETLTFNADEDRRCFFTSAMDDDLLEDDEIYLLTLTSDEPGLTLDPPVATVTIIDDDPIVIGLTNTTFTVTEGDGAFVEVCARVFDGQLERDAVVTLQTVEGTAVSQGAEPDYQSLSVQLTFTPSMTEICRNVIIINDVFYEDPENLDVQLTTVDPAVDLIPDMGTITILDEEAIVIGFVEPSYAIAETGGQQQVCAELVSGNLRTNVVVQFSTSNGDATAPDDYTATSASFTFNASVSQNCVNVPIISDNIIEGSENFSGNLDTSAPRVTLRPDETEISIVDGDFLQIGFIDAPYTTREESGFVTVSVGILSAGVVLDDDFVVTLETMDITTGINNAAQAGVDYVPLSMDLTFNSQVKRIDLNVTIIDDNIVELNEIFSGRLAVVTMGPNAPQSTLNPATAQISILDEVDTITVGLTETLIVTNETVGVRQVCARVIDGNLERNAVVTLNLNPDTATAGEDYIMDSFTLVFSASVRGPICNNVVILNDNIYEFEERLTYNLSTTDASVILDPAGGVMVIQDEDNVVIGWQRVLYEFDESAGQSSICAAVLEGTLAVTLPELNIVTRDGTASRGGLGVQQDYIPMPFPSQFVFSSTNMGSMCTNIPIVNDNVLEQTVEDFFADLFFAIGSEPDRVTISPLTTEVDIIDNDMITIGFLDVSYPVREDVGDAQLMVGVISGDLETNIVVNISTTDDSALSPDDYTGIQNRSLTFSTPLPPMSIPVTILDDLFDEEDIERFTASLTLVTDNPRVQIDPSLAEVLIEDDDVVVIGFERTRYNILENNTETVTVCASIQPLPSPQLAKSVEVVLSSADGTAMAPEDYNAVTTTLTFDPDTSRNCVDFTGFEDGIVEPDENFTVSLTSGDDVVLTPDTAVVTIVEGVVISVGFVEQRYTFVENQPFGIIQVRKSAASDVPFQVRVIGGPSTSSPIEQSAAAVDEIITFMAGPSAPNVIDIMIAITDDLVALEATESYVASLQIVGTPPNVEIGQFPTTTVEVLDNDRVTVGFGSEGVSVVESSGEFRMCVVRDRVALQDITVTIVAQDESAISDVDYTPSGIPVTVTIPASAADMRACFTGPIIDDLIALEPNETFTLSITDISPDDSRIQAGIETTRITIIDDDVVRVRFAQPDYLFREESGLATVCLVKDLETAAGFSVDSSTTPDTALDPMDYTGGNFSVSFETAAGDTQCIDITLISDNEREPLENFFVDVDLNDMGAIRAGNPSRTRVGIEDTGIPANDTVIGDPLMTVPILVSDSVLQKLNATRLSLCYEIHGRRDAFFNLVTDECATVNAHYHDLTNYLNVIDQVGVRAVDNNGLCRNIQVDVDSCSASIDGTQLLAGSRYNQGGISVRRYSNRVRISVPNCNELSLVMWVICETRTLEDPFGDGQVTGDMIKFVVMRGLNFGHRMAHGLLGQFWNIPVSVEPFTGVDRFGAPVPQRYVVNITSSFSGERRSYTGWLYDLTWSFEEGPCLYVGNRQAGPIYEVKEPNDPIIEGRYSEYLVQDLFSEEEFKYTLFNEDNCLASPPTGAIPTETN